MFETVPIEGFILLIIGLWAVDPARYIYRHIKHAPERRDITQPPEDLSWRTQRKFALNAGLLALLAASTVFVFTPQARWFAGSVYFLPTLLTAFGTFALHAAAHGLLSGSVSPLVRGLSGHYSRAEQPGRFWASLIYNAVLGGALLAMAPLAYADGKRSRCIDGAGNPEDALEACSALLDGGGMSPADRRDALLARGKRHAEAGNYEQAMLDLERAIRLDNTEPEAFYQRGLLYAKRGHEQLAHEDFNSAILLDPDHAPARLARGVLYLNQGDPWAACEDLDRADAVDPDNVWILANRAVAQAWLEDLPAARRDLEAARAIEPGNRIVIAGDAILAYQEGRLRAALAHLDKLTEIDPDDSWTKEFRARVAREADPQAAGRVNGGGADAVSSRS